MEKYCFTSNIWDLSDLDNPTYTIKKTIRYKCLICGETREYDENWSDAKKAEVKAETVKHYNEHFNLIV